MYSPAGWRAVAESFWLSLSEIKSQRGCCTTNLSCYCFGCWKIATVTCSLTGRRQLVCKHLPTTSRAVVKPEKKCARNRKQRIFTLKKSQHISKRGSFYFEGKLLCVTHSFTMLREQLGNVCWQVGLSMQTTGDCSSLQATKTRARNNQSGHDSTTM